MTNKTYTLQYPITLPAEDGKQPEVVTQLTFREPMAQDLFDAHELGFHQTNIKAEFGVMCLCAGLSPEVLKGRMHFNDMMAALEFFREPGTPGTPPKPTPKGPTPPEKSDGISDGDLDKDAVEGADSLDNGGGGDSSKT